MVLQKKYEYTNEGIKGLVKKEINQLGKEKIYEYDNYGNKTKFITENGATTIFASNALGWLISTTSPNGYIKAYEYDLNGNNTKLVDDGKVTITEFNHKNNKTKTINPLNGVKIFEYDNSQNLIKLVDENSNITTYEYDCYGNKIKENKANGAEYLYEYDDANRIIKISLNEGETQKILKEMSYTYNNGNKTVVTKKYKDNENYVTYTNVKDFRDNIISKKIHDAEYTYLYTNTGKISEEKNEIGKRIIYTYDDLDRLVKKYDEIEKDKFKVTLYEYDSVGNIAKESTSNEKVNLNEIPSKLVDTVYTYDNVGNILSKEISSGEKYTYTYDLENNKITETEKIEEGKEKFTEYTYTSSNKVKTKKEKIEKSSLYGNQIDDTEYTTLDTMYEYDSLDNLTKEILPDGRSLTYTYDNLGNELTRKISDGKKTITNAKGYDSQSNVISITDGNGATTTYEYDKLNNNIKTVFPNNKIINYEYDLLGNKIKEIKENGLVVINYSYNLYNQMILESINYTEGDNPKSINTNYEYDKLGNLVKETKNDISTSYTYNLSNKCLTKKDANGNTITFEYDANNNVIKQI